MGEACSEMAIVLLVMSDVPRGDAVADELEDRGHEVFMCPGPQPPGFVCAGARNQRCVLAANADVVILDGWLASEEHRRGVPYWHLARYYQAQGLPVVVLVGNEALPGPVPDKTMISLDRNAEVCDAVDAAESLLARDQVSSST